MLRLLLLVWISKASLSLEIRDYFQSPLEKFNLNLGKTTADRIIEYGYMAETHHIITEDGYVLTMFRIPYDKSNNATIQRPRVLLQHGLFSSSDCWIVTGPNDGLPFLLADAGFDVWLGNARGTIYSRSHATYTTNESRYWRFSWHEIGYYDLAAMLDYISSFNSEGRQQQLGGVHYVGHSQGTTSLFVLLSTRPEYNTLIGSAHMLAPAAFMGNMSDPLVRALAPFLGHDNMYAHLFGRQEFLPPTELFMILRYKACSSESNMVGLCTSVAYLLENNIFEINATTLKRFAETHPAGASTDQILHYMQQQQSNRFCQFDFGTHRNLQIYQQSIPPDYPLQSISTTLHLWYSVNDRFVATDDVGRLIDVLPHTELHFIDDPQWSHGDFVLANDVRKEINEPIIRILLENAEQRK